MIPISVELYRDKKGLYRWRMMRRGRIVAECAKEGYTTFRNMMRTLTRIVESSAKGEVEIDPSKLNTRKL